MKTPSSLLLVRNYFDSLHREKVYFWEGPFAPINYTFGWNDQRFYSSFYHTPPFSVFVAITGRDSHILFSDTIYSGYGQEVFQEYWSGNNLVLELEKGYRSIEKKVFDWYEKTIQRDMKDLREEEIITLLAEGAQLYGTMFGHTLYVETFDQDMAFSVIENMKKKSRPENKQRAHDLIAPVWEKATQPYFESFDTRRLRQAVMLIEQKVKHKEKLFWFTGTDFFTHKPLKDIQAKLSSIEANLTHHKKALRERAEKQREESAQYVAWLSSLSDQEKKLAVYAQNAMEIRDHRKDPYNQLQTVQAVLGEELLRRARIDPVLTPYLVSSDLAQGLQTLRTKRAEFAKRPDGFVAYCDKDGQTTSITEDISQTLVYVQQKHLEQEAGLHVGTIKGLVGCQGFIKGKVCVIPDITRAHHFQAGDVIVTGMTRPELMPYMRQAAAIITDEGGITCHAAIVSREFHIPCIIGTKIATKMLKNGDVVEVDAHKGVIRILSSPVQVR